MPMFIIIRYADAQPLRFLNWRWVSQLGSNMQPVQHKQSAAFVLNHVQQSLNLDSFLLQKTDLRRPGLRSACFVRSVPL